MTGILPVREFRRAVSEVMRCDRCGRSRARWQTERSPEPFDPAVHCSCEVSLGNGRLTPESLAAVKEFVAHVLARKLLWDRESEPPPFVRKAVVKYLGPDTAYYGRNACGVVVGTCTGIRGDLVQYTDIGGDPLFWNDDRHAPILMRTIDGSSAIRIGMVRAIATAGSAHLWEVIG